MRILTHGRHLSIINDLLNHSDLELVTENPEVVISHGGDGHLLEAERLYPGIPKLPIRHNSICKNCVDHETSHIINALIQGTLTKTTVPKVETEVNGRRLTALNEISLHHIQPNQAIRFSVQINDEPHVNQAIGDGVVVATPFGSHAYYRSITSSVFRLGLGVAFNNTTEAVDHIVVTPSDAVTIHLLRGPAYLSADNDPDLPTLTEGTTFTVRQSKEVAILMGIDRFPCPDCGGDIVPAKDWEDV